MRDECFSNSHSIPAAHLVLQHKELFNSVFQGLELACADPQNFEFTLSDPVKPRRTVRRGQEKKRLSATGRAPQL